MKEHLFRSHDTWVQFSTWSLISCCDLHWQVALLSSGNIYCVSVMGLVWENQSLITSLGFSFLICNLKALIQMMFNVPFNSIDYKAFFFSSLSVWHSYHGLHRSLLRGSVDDGWEKKLQLKFGTSFDYECRPETVVASAVPEIFVINRSHRHFILNA